MVFGEASRGSSAKETRLASLNDRAPQGSFDKVYLFNLTNTFSAAAAAVTIALTFDNLDIYSIANASLRLFKNEGSLGSFADDGVALGSFTFGTTSTSQLFGNLTSGNYYYRLQGNANGLSGGAFTLASSVTPVPEPGTYALLFAGLGVVGFVARRRRPQQ